MNWPILPLSAWEQTGTIFRSASCAHRISLRHISREKYESAPLSVTMARKHLQFLAPSSIAAMSRLSMRTSSQTVKPISLKLLKRSSQSIVAAPSRCVWLRKKSHSPGGLMTPWEWGAIFATLLPPRRSQTTIAPAQRSATTTAPPTTPAMRATETPASSSLGG